MRICHVQSFNACEHFELIPAFFTASTDGFHIAQAALALDFLRFHSIAFVTVKILII